MPTIASATRYAIEIDGHALFLFAGDLPYHRLPPHRWRETLDRLRAAHLNAVTLSAPWAWHEPEEGGFDLEGISHPQRNLAGALALCGEYGLHIVFRPGPHIGGGGRYDGIPEWLLGTRPEILALDAQGHPPRTAAGCPPISYRHPVYEAYVAGWYQAFLPLLRQTLLAQKSTLIAVQIDDRSSYGPGLWGGDPLLVDYNPCVVGEGRNPGYYQRWLAARYGNIRDLNQRYQTRYRSFVEVQPPRHPLTSLGQLPWFSDWRRCKMDLVNQHLEYLYEWLREGGVDVPVAVLHPYQTPLAARRCADYFRLRGKPVLVAHSTGAPGVCARRSSELALGPLIATARLAHHWVKDMDLPAANLETPAALAPGLNAEVLAAICVTQIGQGLNGLGLASMVEGEGATDSRRRRRDSGFPIGLRGELRPHYGAIKRLGRFLQVHGERLARTQPLSDVALGWYEPYEDCGQQGDARIVGWRDDYRRLLDVGVGLACDGEHPAGGGLLGAMALSGLSCCMLDLERDPLEDWLAYRQLWVVGLDFMAASVQQDLIAYVEAGGNLVMLPRVPYLDDDLRPCQRLAELFPAPVRRRPARASAARWLLAAQAVWPLAAGLTAPLAGEPAPSRPPGAQSRGEPAGPERGMEALGPVDTFDLPANAEPLAWTGPDHLPCAYRICRGRGSATLLGFVPVMGKRAQPDPQSLIASLAAQAGVHPHAASNPCGLHVVERATPLGAADPAGYLFVVNPQPSALSAHVTYTDPRTGRPATLPRTNRGLECGPHGALILALELPIPGSGLTIAYSTSQIQGWSVDDGQVLLTLYGPPGTMGETAFRVDLAGPASGEAGELVTVTYPHHHGTTLLRVRA